MSGIFKAFNLRKAKYVLFSAAITTAVVVLSNIFAGGRLCEIFCTLKHPPFSLLMKNYSWIYLFFCILSGCAAGRVFALESCEERTDALYKYSLQLAVSFFWPVMFFRLSLYAFSGKWAIVLVLLLILAIKAFYGFDKTTGRLMIPYFIWVLYGLYMNIGMWILN